ncbi:MAG: biopolymer transporter ExbD [Thiocapsa sp.]|jgi:biopolymer transport protein ExbD|nr:biopolymer transporter ExbD [Thiocapsa sp.]MCG6897159.1 biopolymer transporter ExbD [Thiocapsa sp.]MCG6986146.1 biopolymer transporter ExbD [Thiocapsa sp.]
MRFESSTPHRRLISLTPLVDVVFILLVFFMLASTLDKWHALELDAPASAADGTPLVGSWLVRLRGDGLDLNGEAMDAGELAQRVAARIAEYPDQRILLQPAQGVSLQQLVDIIDRLRDAEAAHLTLLQP